MCGNGANAAATPPLPLRVDYTFHEFCDTGFDRGVVANIVTNRATCHGSVMGRVDAVFMVTLIVIGKLGQVRRFYEHPHF